MHKDLLAINDKVVVIVGGAGLIGQAFVEACALNGATVVIADINKKESDRLVLEISRRVKRDVFYRKCDMNSREDVKNLISYLVKKFGKIDGLVNCAYPKSRNYGKKFEDVDYEDFNETLKLNLGGVFQITSQIAKVMIRQKSGNIVNISSIYGFRAPRFDVYGKTKMTAPVEYAAIKGGLMNLTLYLASYLGKYNIRVNTISPGGVLDNQPKDFVKNYSKMVPLYGRMARVSDLVGALIFLLSDSSAYITGQNIVVDGGWSI